mmetsp:Transcript_27385/g.40128  ORF Transcript_27385/g.40128 Transcript_27385/m.40128 type:complete len:408 (-) Transcript_27385:312-1535(-)|eukprot:CAMPEP_0194042032 /NCGR_PEP_ID=MMETSP0009_2-20130614/13828_1 /TAXON_ID=210454 /ORGANISM="Grammatophora oceanica, Strain CCMP 410" /LENGTH=407 /DNA_ID=CAMNT_0038685719 /DNA_START=44 /DNA_END=1267 /DNA_ORIENTATION=+
MWGSSSVEAGKELATQSQKGVSFGDLENGKHVINETTPLATSVLPSPEGAFSRQASSMESSISSIRSVRPLPGMQIRSHSIDTSSGALRECSVKEALSKGRAGRGAFWVDVDADERDQEELEQWLSQLKLSPFLAGRLSEPPQTWASQVIPFKSSVLAVIRILPEHEASDELAHVAALAINKSLLLTFTSCSRSETGGLYLMALRELHARESIAAPSSSGVLLTWLQFHIERTSKCTRELRNNVLKMDEDMDREIESCDLEEIVQTKDQLLRLLSVTEEQNECLEALAKAETDTDALDFSQQKGALGVLLATASATERMTLRLEKHISDLRHRHESHQQERMNRRLAVLTVLSAVFLPLTLVTGIWGMNFEYMPELYNHDAYPIALLCMCLIAVSMVCYFWRSGWFD